MKNVLKYSVLEDNGGGLHLAVFNASGKCVYFHSGYEYGKVGQLTSDLKLLEDGVDPVIDWDGNEDDPQAVYDDFISYDYGWEVVADNNGVYFDLMGEAAQSEFQSLRGD